VTSFAGWRRLELYNLADDIGEMQNLARELPEKTRELHAMLKSWRDSLGVNARILDQPL
jgi:hypothetical protein